MDPTKLTDTEILALTLIGEARGEPIEGQVAVGCVIRNRLHNRPDKYTSYSSVCLERNQFSCWNFSDPNRTILDELGSKMLLGQALNDPSIRQCLLVAKGIVDWSITDNTGGSLYYITNKLFADGRPSWASNPINPKVKGNQTFFNV